MITICNKIFFILAGLLMGEISAVCMVNNCGADLFNTKPHASYMNEIEWLDLETASDRNKDEKKFFFIDIYTNWCGWCKKMDQSTFTDSAVVEYMNKNFYAVKLNAESRDPIVYREILYEYKMYNGKGYNELAVNLLSGKMSFPSFVILSKKEVRLKVINGFQKPGELLNQLKEVTN